jgi:hypothetical protein
MVTCRPVDRHHSISFNIAAITAILSILYQISSPAIAAVIHLVRERSRVRKRVAAEALDILPVHYSDLLKTLAG